jgi:hypothetical protein
VGGYDPDFFIWYEDVDWCYRAWHKGWKLVALRGLKVTHWGGASFANWSADQFKWQFVRSFFRFLSKHRKESLLRWSSAVLRADLRLKSVLFPLLRRLRVGGIPDYSAGLEEMLRLTILDIAAAHHRGELVAFSSTDAAVPNSERSPQALNAADWHIDAMQARTGSGSNDEGLQASRVSAARQR